SRQGARPRRRPLRLSVNLLGWLKPPAMAVTSKPYTIRTVESSSFVGCSSASPSSAPPSTHPGGPALPASGKSSFPRCANTCAPFEFFGSLTVYCSPLSTPQAFSSASYRTCLPQANPEGSWLNPNAIRTTANDAISVRNFLRGTIRPRPRSSTG